MLSNKTNSLRRILMAAVVVAVGGLAIGAASAPAQAQYYSPGYGYHYYSGSPYYNAYEAHRAWWRWHQYWRWYHYNYR